MANSGAGAAIGPLTRIDLDAELAVLPDMSASELRSRWMTLTGDVAPDVRAPLLRMALAWELQARVHGGLSRSTLRDLSQAAEGKAPRTMAVAPGTRLVREWNGVLHTVTIDEDGVIIWDDRRWRSTSAVARAITGTRWSGPVFFGLAKQKQKRAA